MTSVKQIKLVHILVCKKKKTKNEKQYEGMIVRCARPSDHFVYCEYLNVHALRSVFIVRTLNINLNHDK